MHSMFADKKINLRCPKCKSASFQLSECVEEFVYYDVVDGLMPKHATDHEAGGSIELGATCSKCSHKWTPRSKSLSGVVQE